MSFSKRNPSSCLRDQWIMQIKYLSITLLKDVQTVSVAVLPQIKVCEHIVQRLTMFLKIVKEQRRVVKFMYISIFRWIQEVTVLFTQQNGRSLIVWWSGFVFSKISAAVYNITSLQLVIGFWQISVKFNVQLILLTSRSPVFYVQDRHFLALCLLNHSADTAFIQGQISFTLSLVR